MKHPTSMGHKSALMVPLKGKSASRYIVHRLQHDLRTLMSFPKYFLIETVNVCNSDCTMCAFDFRRRNPRRMPGALFDNIVREIGEYASHVEKVALYWGGEPLLDPLLPQRIRQLKQAGVKCVNIASNGSLLTRSKARDIIAAGLDEIFFSIDSLDPETYESIRRGLKFHDVYRQVCELVNMRDALLSRLRIRVQMVVQETNAKEFPGFERHWQNILSHRDQIVAQKLHNWSYTDPWTQAEDETCNHLPCISPFGTLAIDVDGHVRLCCTDIEPQYDFGNVGDSSIREIWQGKALDDIRRRHLAGRRSTIGICNGCTVWRDDKHAFEQGGSSFEDGF